MEAEEVRDHGYPRCRDRGNAPHGELIRTTTTTTLLALTSRPHTSREPTPSRPRMAGGNLILTLDDGTTAKLPTQ